MLVNMPLSLLILLLLLSGNYLPPSILFPISELIIVSGITALTYLKWIKHIVWNREYKYGRRTWNNVRLGWWWICPWYCRYEWEGLLLIGGEEGVLKRWSIFEGFSDTEYSRRRRFERRNSISWFQFEQGVTKQSMEQQTHLNIFACGLSTFPTYVHNISNLNLDGMPMHRRSASMKLRLLATTVGDSIAIHWFRCVGSALPNIPSISWFVWSHLGNTKSSILSIVVFCRVSIGCWFVGSKQNSRSSSRVNDCVHPTNIFLAKPTVYRHVLMQPENRVRYRWRSEAMDINQRTVPVGEEVLHWPANPVSNIAKPAFWAITYEAVWFTVGGALAPRVGAPTMYPGLPLRIRDMRLFFTWLRSEGSTSIGMKFTENSCCNSRMEASISRVSMSPEMLTIVVWLYLTL